MSGIMLAFAGGSYGAAPVNTVAPVVSGTATVGQTLSTTNGTWTGAPAPTFTYQWQRVATNISGATSSTYVLVSADAGNTIRCVVKATNTIAPAGVTANSNSTASVAATVPGAPTIGTATQTGGTTATVVFTQPADNGGATITSYTATSSPSGGTGTLSQAGSGTITVSGLTVSTSYTFTVKATNSAGQSAASAASNSITTSGYTTFTLGSTTAVGTGGGTGQISLISATEAIIVWAQAGPSKGASSLYARYVTISGTTVSLTGSIATLISDSFNLSSAFITNVDSTYSLLSLGRGGLRLLKLVGTTPTLVGSTILGDPLDVVGRQQGILTSTTYLVGMARSGSGDEVRACVVTRSGDTISAGAIAALGTGGMSVSADSIGTAVNGTTTAGVISYNDRLYPVTISGGTCTIGSGYITATGGGTNNGSCVAAITPTANRYLLTAAATGGANVGCRIVDQSGSSLTAYTGVNFGFTPGRVPANSWCAVMRSSSTVAATRGEFGQAFGINISGTTISATSTNVLSSGTNGNTFVGITTTQILISVGGNVLTGVATVS